MVLILESCLQHEPDRALSVHGYVRSAMRTGVAPPLSSVEAWSHWLGGLIQRRWQHCCAV